ncbi:MAG: helical backbone metal receptor [Planctomycetota bacterium]
MQRKRLIAVGCHWLFVASASSLARAGEPTKTPPSSPPQRIIAIAPNSAEVICALGACDRIVGVGKFCVYPPELLARPKVGGLSDPDLERIAALRPDLLVMRGRNDALERLCEDLHVPIYKDETDTLPGIENCLGELGTRLGLNEQAKAIIKDFRDRLDAIRARNVGKRPPRVLLTVSRQPDRLANVLTTGKGTFLDQMIEIACGINVFGHLDMIYPQVSPEGMLAQQPEVIIELMPDLKLTAALKEQMGEQWKQLGSMPAVTKNRIYVLTDENGLIPSPRYVEIIDKVARLLHPESDVAP